MSKPKSPVTRVGGRDSRSGEFVPLRETQRRPDTTQRERIPLPGHGDTGRGDKKSREYRTSPSGQFTERDSRSMTSAKGEKLVVYRDSKTGAFTTRKSAEVIKEVTKQAANSLRRLAKR